MAMRTGGGAPRKLKADDFVPGKATQVSVSLDGGELRAIDLAIEKLNRAADGPAWTRSLVIRAAVRDWLAKRRVPIPTRKDGKVVLRIPSGQPRKR